MSGRPRRPLLPLRRSPAIVLLAMAVYGLAALYHARPAVLSCTTRTIGTAGDGTAGGVWLAWAFERQGGLPVRDWTYLTAAPGGETFWRPEWWTQSLLYLPLWLYGHVTNPVCSYNLVVLSGFLASALAMFALAWWLTRNVPISLLAGYAFGFAPFAQLKAAGHLAYVHQEMFPLILLAALALLERPTLRRGAVLGAVMGVAGYLDGYYLLFSCLTVGSLLGFALVRMLWRRRTDRRAGSGTPVEPGVQGARLVRSLLVAGAVAVALVVPLAWAYLAGSDTVEAGVTRSTVDLDVYSADLNDYVLPARTSPIFDDVFGSWQDRHLEGSNHSEATLFLGWSTIALAGVALVAVVMGRGRTSRPGLGARWRQAVPLLVFTAIALGIASGPRVWELFGVRFPGVSWFVYAVAPYWRVYARLFIPVHAAALAAAAVGATMVLGRLRTVPARVVVLAALALIIGIETTASPPLRYAYLDYAAAPAGYRWLAEQDDVHLIADAPVWPVSAQPDGAFATFQPVHGKAVVNPKSTVSEGAELNAEVLGLADAQTVPILRALGVDLVVVHPDLMPGQAPASPPPGLELVRSFRFADQAATEMTTAQVERHVHLAAWYDMDIYRISSGPAARVAAVPGRGFHPPELTGWRSAQWVAEPAAALQVISLDAQADEVDVRLRAASSAITRQVRFIQDGAVLWSGEVGTGWADIEFRARAGEVLIDSSPPPEPLKAHDPATPDPRTVSLYLSDLEAEPLEGDRGGSAMVGPRGS